MERIKTVTVCGPTASGKTKLGVLLAERLNGEVVSADSIQIYKHIDIASAKPTKDEMHGIIHHLIDYVDPSEKYSVARYVSDANVAIDEIVCKGKTPIIVGGTGLYIDALLNNTRLLDNGFNEDVRNDLKNRFEQYGSEVLYEDLKKIDPAAAEKIHPNNSIKIIRALEIYYSSGKTLTEQNEQSHTEPSRFENITIFLNCESRDYLYDRIDRRVDVMIKNGLLREAELYYKNNYSQTSSQTIGYKELKPYLDGECELNECIDNLKRATRNYAKRQLTWFRRYKDAHVFYIDKYVTSDELFFDVMKVLDREGR